MKSLLWLKGIEVAVQMAYPKERSAVDVCLTAWASETTGLLGKIAMKWTWIFHESTGN